MKTASVCSLWLVVGGLGAGCAGADMLSAEEDRSGKGSDAYYPPGGPCGGIDCPSGFHCEFDQCVADVPPPPPPSAEPRDPLASNRYVFSLDTAQRRLARIDSLTLEVAAFAAGLAPMDLGVVGSRELSVLLDAMDLVEVLDHRQEPPVAAAWSTARSLSHVRLSPSGEHLVAYFDWDDPRAQDRQPEPGNINQVSVLSLADGAAPFADEDARLVNVAVGFLPRDVRFAADGSRAVVISQDTLTPIALTTVEVGVATPAPTVPFDGSAAEILIDATATTALVRYAGNARVDLLSLDGGAAGCLVAPGAVSDVALARDGQLVLSFVDGGAQGLAVVPPAAALPDPCAPVVASVQVQDASQLAVDPAADLALVYQADLAVETIWLVDLIAGTARSVALEKAVVAVAFAGDGRHVHLSHLKAPGVPAWDPRVEHPEVSVDKSYGVSWLDAVTGSHRLAVSDEPFGPFSFVPQTSVQEGATFQAVVDAEEPQLLRVTHRPGFDDRWIDLAAKPLQMGYLKDTARTYVTQSHPWGRITFVDPSGTELRHVTGFALEVR